MLFYLNNKSLSKFRQESSFRKKNMCQNLRIKKKKKKAEYVYLDLSWFCYLIESFMSFWCLKSIQYRNDSYGIGRIFHRLYQLFYK